MKVAWLEPKVVNKVHFTWKGHILVPDSAGCYAITTFSEEVVYVGIASSLRNRMGDHLETPEKRGGFNGEVSYWFHFLEEGNEYQRKRIEAGWLLLSTAIDGCYPPLNKIASPA